jgi:mannose-1-phosphate guanylyltransferase/mannose-6-phosphate isomerase
MTNTSSDIPAIPVIPVILCGGSGTRLWPLSRSGFPKQFLVLSGDNSAKSLFQQAVERLNTVGSGNIQTSIAVGETLIVTNEEHRFLVTDQLRELPQVKASLLLEPIGRNTAPALTLAALYSSEPDSESNATFVDPILVVTPADQTIQDGAAFTKAL